MVAASPYSSQRYARIRRMQLGRPVKCAHCQREVATTLDHDPPLAMHVHREGSDCCRMIPSCWACNITGGVAVREGVWRPEFSPVDTEPEPEPLGIPSDDERWRVPWLAPVWPVPDYATWPRYMTVPHPDAAGSLGPEVIAWAEQRSGRELRWWQRLVALRVLEVDTAGRLVWEAAVLTMARQLGKSWFLRELLLWRIHQGGRFGEPQDVLHTGKDLAVCKEVQRPARIWAKARKDTYRVREVNGQEEIELMADGSRWMLRAKEAVYGYSVSMAAADEAWKVRASSIDEGLTPTMTEREQPQLLLVSTAHRLATSLMLGRRQGALTALESGAGDLLVEWSAPAGCEPHDVNAWRMASPHWTPKRQAHIARQLEAVRSGETADPEEPDPEESFRAQWLNQWPRKRVEVSGDTEALLPDGVWAGLAATGVRAEGPVWLAVEDDVGFGAAVGACAKTPDGLYEVDGWLCPDWDTAVVDVELLAKARSVRALLVGASLRDRVTTGLAVGPRETRAGLALLRDLAMAGAVVHDTASPDLDEAMGTAMVRESSAGLVLMAKGPTHLVRAVVWALQAAHKRSRIPVIH